VRRGRRIPIAVERPAQGNLGIAIGVVDDLSGRDVRGGHVEDEWVGVGRNADGDRIRPDQGLSSSEGVHQSLADRHPEKREAVTSHLLRVEGEHPEVVRGVDRGGRDAGAIHPLFQLLERTHGDHGAQTLLAVDEQQGLAEGSVAAGGGRTRHGSVETFGDALQAQDAVRGMTAHLGREQEVDLKLGVAFWDTASNKDVLTHRAQSLNW